MTGGTQCPLSTFTTAGGVGGGLERPDFDKNCFCVAKTSLKMDLEKIFDAVWGITGAHMGAPLPAFVGKGTFAEIFAFVALSVAEGRQLSRRESRIPAGNA